MQINQIAKTLLLFFLTIASLPVHAVTITAENEASDLTSTSGTRTIYFPIVGASGSLCANSRTYPTTLSAIDPAGTVSSYSPGLLFKITATKELYIIAGKSSSSDTINTDDISIRVESSSNQVALLDYGHGYSNSTGTEIPYGNTTSDVEFGISLPDTPNSTTGNGLCHYFSGASCDISPGDAAKSISLKIGLINKGNASALDAESSSDYATVNITLAACPPGADSTPQIVAPTQNLAVEPGDGKLTVANLGTTPTDVISIKSVVAVATEGKPVLYSSDSAKRVESTGTGGGTFSFENLTNDTKYCVSIGYVNQAGLITTGANWSDTMELQESACATPSQVSGFLDHSNCFIATATYGTEWNQKLEILRQFRDQYLLHSNLGKKFVNWYYGWSPKAARAILEKPLYQATLRILLFPIVEAIRFFLWITQHLLLSGAIFLLSAGLVLATLIAAPAQRLKGDLKTDPKIDLGSGPNSKPSQNDGKANA